MCFLYILSLKRLLTLKNNKVIEGFFNSCSQEWKIFIKKIKLLIFFQCIKYIKNLANINHKRKAPSLQNSSLVSR